MNATPPSPGPLARALSGYTEQSVRLMPVIFVVYLVVGLASRRQGIPPLGTDVPVLFIWGGLTLLILWGVRPRRDLAMTLGAMAGGLFLEWWGTTTELWHYFSAQRPPPWVLAAWPAVGLAADRLAQVLRSSRSLAFLHWPLILLAFGALASLSRPALAHPTTLAVFAVAAVLACAPGDRDEDARVFLAGAFIGVFIEWWGTTRGVWTYHDGRTPPWEAIVAHGLASVTFVRAASWLLRLRPPRP